MSVTICGPARSDPFTWTMLTPEHDSRDGEVRDFDDFLSKDQLDVMNKREAFFQHHLAWQKIPIAHLLSTPAPFCELDFDAMKPLLLTVDEKKILKEYLTRGGFILFSEDAYPYTQDEFWRVKKWPIVDFVTTELPAADPLFKAEKITEKHPLFRQTHITKIPDEERHELQGNPSSPYLTLVTYRGLPCAFIDAQYTRLNQGKWIALPRPFDHNLEEDEEGYELSVNIYIYVMTH